MIALSFGIVVAILCIYGMYRVYKSHHQQKAELYVCLVGALVMTAIPTSYFCVEWWITCDISRSETGIVIQSKIYHNFEPYGRIPWEHYKTLKHRAKAIDILCEGEHVLSDEIKEQLNAIVVAAHELEESYARRPGREKHREERAARLREAAAEFVRTKP